MGDTGQADVNDEATDPTPVQEPTAQSAADYLARRLRPQLAWYEKRARDAKRWHYGLACVQIFSTISIPVVNVFAHSVYLSSTLGGLAALATAMSSLFGHQDQWLVYRQTAGTLEALQVRYELGLDPFNGSDRHGRLIREAESVLEGEGMKWSEGVKQRGSSSRTPGVIISA